MYNLNGYIQALKDEEAGVRAPAALALGQIGKPAVAEFHISQPTHGKGLSPVLTIIPKKLSHSSRTLPNNGSGILWD